MPPAIAALEPDQKSSAQVGNREQAPGVELLRARHRAAELGDPAIGYADVSGFPVSGRCHGRAAYNEVKAHRSIVHAPARPTVSWQTVMIMTSEA